MKFKEIFKTALYRFSDYPSLLFVRRLKTFFYVVFLALIMLVGLTVTIVPLVWQAGGPIEIMQNDLPEFSVKDGKLKCEKKLDIKDEEKDFYIKVDDSAEGVLQLPEDYSFAVAVSKTDISSNISGVNGIKFSEMDDFTKSDLIEWFKKHQYVIYLSLAGYMLLFFVVSTYVTALIYAAFATVANALFIRAQLRFFAIFKLAIFAMTLPVILNMIFAFLKMRFAFLAPFLTMFYLIKGMWACKKSDGYIIEVL